MAKSKIILPVYTDAEAAAMQLAPGELYYNKTQDQLYVTRNNRTDGTAEGGGGGGGGPVFDTFYEVDLGSEFETAQGGDVRIASTGALTVTGITFESNELATMPLSHVGAAGNFYECIFEFNTTESAPIVLDPGQLLAVRNPAAMDAAGTWQMAIRVNWYEEDTTTL